MRLRHGFLHGGPDVGFTARGTATDGKRPVGFEGARRRLTLAAATVAPALGVPGSSWAARLEARDHKRASWLAAMTVGGRGRLYSPGDICDGDGYHDHGEPEDR
jgi:hypothetical protein